MTEDGRAVANFILDYCEEGGIAVTNLSLQKLMYFCHVWSLVRLKQPLVKQSFEAWEFGPVLPFLYREFKNFDRNPITTRCQKKNFATGELEVVEKFKDPSVSAFLREILLFYSRLSSGQLVELSHVENGPWHKVWFHDGSIHPGMKIRDKDILSFYSRGGAASTLQ